MQNISLNLLEAHHVIGSGRLEAHFVCVYGRPNGSVLVHTVSTQL